MATSFGVRFVGGRGKPFRNTYRKMLIDYVLYNLKTLFILLINQLVV